MNKKNKTILFFILCLLLLSSNLFADKIRDMLDKLPFEVAGFFEAAEGIRTQSDAFENESSLNEIRLRMEVDGSIDWLEYSVKKDFYYDGVLTSWLGRYRELKASGAFDTFDVKIGRQTLTWGTGDLLFINDLFPKDWQSFFTGRDVEYLKSPSDAVKISFYPEFITIDLVYSPQFDPDNYITGQRISYYNPLIASTAGREVRIETETPDRWFEDSEYALRLKKMIGSIELAGYLYNGFWKTPAGFDPAATKFTFPPLSVYGISLRGNILEGIGNTEIGYYDSRDDRNGNNPNIDNSQIRFLAGYEQEIWTNGTIGFQYYLEHMMEYSRYKNNAPDPSTLEDENRHVLTIRFTQFLMQQNLKISVFTYYSPSDNDLYSRPSISYKITDSLTVTAGTNLFYGKNNHTFFGQFEDNTNVYLRVRYSF